MTSSLEFMTIINDGKYGDNMATSQMLVMQCYVKRYKMQTCMDARVTNM